MIPATRATGVPDSILNVGEFLSDHWLAEGFPAKLKSLAAGWKAADDAGGVSIPRALASAATGFNQLRLDLPRPDDPAYAATLTAMHSVLLESVGFDSVPQTLTTFHGDSQVDIPLLVRARASGGEMLHVLQARPVDSPDELLSGDAGLLNPIVLDPHKGKPTRIHGVAEAISLLFLVDQADSPRRVLVAAGPWLLLTDAARWAEGRYLAFDIDTALARRDAKHKGELAWHAGLWSADVLLPPLTGEAARIEEFSDDSVKHAVGVSEDLREGLRLSVELIANEALAMRREKGLPVEGIDELPGEITTQTLRFLYRILFLLFAEARPELGILPVGAPEYGAGYGIDRLRELIQVPLGPQAAKGSHFHDSLDVLFGLVNTGHGHTGGDGASDGLVFEPLQADLFSPARCDHIDSIRLGNATLQKVLELLLLSKQPTGKNKQRGYVSYAQLGINQLGAVYEGLMAYTGFIAAQDLVELAKDADSGKGTWMVPVEKVGDYDEKHLVKRPNDSGALEKVVHKRGSFVYRLAGRDRQRSASFYTPEILTRTVVKHALAELITDETAAADLLEYRICEPALGSGAFANEAINQLATEYLQRRQKETDQTIDPAHWQEELQKVKAWIALHRVYGVDLNATAVELAEVSMWLNVMHPGLQAPWFGMHLRRGNSLIGARRATYYLPPNGALRKTWHATSPKDRNLVDGGIGAREVHHFLLPAAGWGAAGDAEETKELSPARAQALRTWSGSVRRALTSSDTNRLIGLATRVERLWALTQRRLEISEYEIARTIDVWNHPNPTTGGGVTRSEVENALLDPDSPYQRLRLAMDAWCALFFWPVTDQTPPPPSRDEWITTLEALLGTQGKQPATPGQTELHDLPNDFQALGDLDEREADLYFMKPPEDVIASTAWLATARTIAEREGFFHWDLDFAHVFARGGFDLQVGNPPWVRPVWQEDVVLAEFDPYLMLVQKIPTATFRARRGNILASPLSSQRYLEEATAAAGLTTVLGSAVEHPVLAGVQTNLYLLFMERVWRSAQSKRGVAALLHPESHFTDPNAGLLREATYRRLRRHFQFSNHAQLFPDIGGTRTYGIHVYGVLGSVGFLQMAGLLHPSTIDQSLAHLGGGQIPGMKMPNGDWDRRPHASRVVQINEAVLGQWAGLFDTLGTPALQARLLRPIVREHLEAIALLAAYPTRMADVGYQWTSGWHEKGAKEAGSIVWDTRQPKTWEEVILQGPHFFVATPFGKQPNEECRGKGDYTKWDLTTLPESVIPRTNYQRSCERARYDDGIPIWFGIRATEHFRIAWRNMVDPFTERTLIAAIVPPGAGHIHAVSTMSTNSPVLDVLSVALWSSIPFDFMTKVAGTTNMVGTTIDKFPAGRVDHRARAPLLLRIIRLNCLTRTYAELWRQVWDNAFLQDSWTAPFTHLSTLNSVGPEWSMATPLRTDESRRAALVEIDVLAALMLGLTSDQLVAMFTGQMAVMRKYEYGMWFDANGRVIAKDNAARGASQQDRDYGNMQAFLAGEPYGDLLERYTPPFRQPDREAEMRAAYTEFQDRLGL